jgi:hypothetical protein
MGQFTLPDLKIVDCDAFCKVIFSASHPRICSGTFSTGSTLRVTGSQIYWRSGAPAGSMSFSFPLFGWSSSHLRIKAHDTRSKRTATMIRAQIRTGKGRSTYPHLSQVRLPLSSLMPQCGQSIPSLSKSPMALRIWAVILIWTVRRTPRVTSRAKEPARKAAALLAVWLTLLLALTKPLFCENSVGFHWFFKTRFCYSL